MNRPIYTRWTPLASGQTYRMVEAALSALQTQTVVAILVPHDSQVHEITGVVQKLGYEITAVRDTCRLEISRKGRQDRWGEIHIVTLKNNPQGWRKDMPLFVDHAASERITEQFLRGLGW